MKIFYDFHIHSCLSPCGGEEMTPANIVGLAKVVGLDAIALTDHNSVKNVRAATEASREINGPLVLPGMEMETSENIHVITLFETIGGAEAFADVIAEGLFKIRNNEQIYGPQLVMDARDNVVGKEDNLLVVSTSVGLYETAELAKRFGGVAIPAHIDRPANGILSILGAIDDDMGFDTLEITRSPKENTRAFYEGLGYLVTQDSDAHILEHINMRGGANFLKVNALTSREIIAVLRNGAGRRKPGSRRQGR